MGNLLTRGIQTALTALDWLYFVREAGSIEFRAQLSTLKAWLLNGVVDPFDYGAFADGDSHPLSSVYGAGAPGLAAAQAVYPFATAVTQEIDYCAVKAASNAAFGADGAENGNNSHLNKILKLPRGVLRFGNDTWLMTHLVGALIKGGGNRATIIRGNVTPIATDGCWYTVFKDFSIELQSASGTVAFDLDGNVAGVGTTRGVQAVTLWNMLIDGGGSTYALAVCRQGGSAGQGSECKFFLHLSNASFAPYFQSGFNALANTFFGGNFQNYPKNGAYVTGGTVAFYNTGFQSTKGYRQIESDGWDINVGSAGAYEACVVQGCRTESLRFLKNHGSVKVAISGIGGQVAVPGWSATTAYGSAAPQYKAVVESGRLFVATTEGTSGGSIPDFAGVAYEGTVADGATLVWTHVVFNFIDIATHGGTLDWGSVTYDAGDISAPVTPYIPGTKDANYEMFVGEHMVVMDASGGARTVKLPYPMTPAMRGYEVTIKKSDASGNAVTVDGQNAVEGGGTTLSVPGGSRGSLTVVWADSTTGGVTQWLVTGMV